MTDFSEETDSQRISHSSSNDCFPAGLSDVTGDIDEQTGSLSFAGELDSLRQAREIIPQIRNQSVAKQTKRLVSIIHRMIQLVKEAKPELNDIPLLQAYTDEDGSVLLEWIFPDFRVGFNIEPNPDDSGWHLVSNNKLEEYTASGQLGNMGERVANLLMFILSNI